MLNIDPLLFQPKVIRMSTTSSIGLPGQHIIRTTEFSNSQVMTGTAAQIHNEANNNILHTNTIDPAGEFASRGRDFGSVSGRRDRRNVNEMELTSSMDHETSDRDLEGQPSEWTAEMYWSGEGDFSDNSTLERLAQQNSASIMSFQSNLSSSTASTSFHSQLSEQSESKEEIINSMLNKVRSHNKVEASKILLAMSNSVENCIAMRQCGVLPLLIQLLHSPDENSNTYHMIHAKRVNFEIRERASQVLHNIVFSQPDDKKGRREARVLRLLEQIRDYCDQLRNLDMDVDDNRNSRCVDQHLGPAVAALMKLSFDEDHRYAMCQLGGLQAIAELLQIDHEVHGCTSDQYCNTIRRYSGMALTNLTFGDGANKALLCSMRPFMEALVAQLYSPSEDLRQVTASVLRNLSWRADTASKRILREVGAVTILVKAAMEAEKESTLKSILSALWNLSAHCSANKADICGVDGALAFLVSTLTYKSKSKNLAIVENGGGILRNVSSHIAIQNDYRVILRKHNCLQILLQHLKSPSLTVVSNACGTLWNLSARNAVDQRALWEMGAVGMLKKLINSKHKMISMGSSAALKNLLSAKPPGVALGLCVHNDGYKGSAEVPSLHIRKEKALSQEIDQNLAETYDNTDSPKTSPSHHATNEKTNRVRRHISPSARYMTAQKQKNDILSLQKRSEVNDDKLTYVTEEKHNGTFQVTKNAKQAMNFKQGQNWLQVDMKEKMEYAMPQYMPDKSLMDKNHDSMKFKPSKPEGQQIVPPKPPHTSKIRTESPPKYTTDNFCPQLGVKKDYKGTDRVTNVAQKSRTISRDQSASPKHMVEASGIPKPTHESRIPLPKSCSKLDATQRSQSSSPVPQRRAIPQRQDNLQSSASQRNLDVTITQPKYAWTSNCEKEDNEPEPRVCMQKQEPVLPHPRLESKMFKPFPSGVPNADDYCYGSEDEVKVYQTENTPLNYSLNSSMNDLEEIGAAARCSLNIRTSTNVKVMKNHPLLSNVSNNRADDDGSRLFEYRHGAKDYRNFEEGRTVDFSVQSDYDIDENLSIMSRSSSVNSISSFDQQSFHDDESFASDLSHHTSGIESPSELSDSPCQTVPSSPQKAIRGYCTASNSSDAEQMKSAAVDCTTANDEHVDKEISASSADGSSVYQNAETGILENEDQEESVTLNVNETSSSKPVKTSLSSNVQTKTKDELEENEIDVLAAKLADDNYPSSPQPVEKDGLYHLLDDDRSKAQNEEQSVSETTADFVTCASELGSCSSIERENFEDISPIERVMLEKCIRAGLPQKNPEQTQGVRQKIPHLSYQLLRDTVEKHPQACSFESDRSTSLKSLELKENEYESHSENEEKGKEDERKAEKKRLFRIPESPVDKKVTTDSNKSDSSPAEEKEYKPTESSNQPCSLKTLVEQKGNRRGEKVKSKQGSSEPMPSQLDFLMTSRKTNSTDTCADGVKISQKTIERAEEKSHCKIRNAESVVSESTKNITDVSADSINNKSSRVKPDKAISDEPLTADSLSKSDHEQDDTEERAGKLEKDIDCSEKENNGDSDESMLSSSLLCEAREIAEALLGARIGSTEDMTVSTLSCLSDIDNARPPSALGEMGSLSMTNSIDSEENLKAAVTKECQKLLGKAYNKQTPSTKKSLLRELQIGRLNSEHGSNDLSKGSYESPENLSMKSSCASDLLGNVNPPSILDDMSLTASTGSIEGSDSECYSEKVMAPYPSKQDSSMSERMNDAAALAQLCAKELSNITGNCIKESPSNDALSRMKTQSGVQEVMEVTIADVTEIGCDTIGSDTELEDDLPCDDEDPGSDTLQAPFQNSLSKEDQGEGSIENLTLTLTEEPQRNQPDLSPYFDFSKNNGCFMSAEEFRALQENADMILNTLREAEISDDEDDEDRCGMSNGDMLDDETMSLVSNESDEEFLSPDSSTNPHLPKQSPKSDYKTSQVFNGMVALPQSSHNVPSKYSRKTSLPQTFSKNKPFNSGLQKPDEYTPRNRNSYPGPCQVPGNIPQFSESPKKSAVVMRTNQINENGLSRIRPPASNRKSLDSFPGFNENYSVGEYIKTPEDESSGGFDTRTFTRKKSTVPRNMIPSIPSGPAPMTGTLRSPSSHNIPSLPGSTDSINSTKTSEPTKVQSRIAAVWKTGKVRSKSVVDANRNSKFRLEKSASTGSAKDEKFVANHPERSPSQTPSPQSPLSRSSTYEKLNEGDGNSPSLLRRPSTLPISQKAASPRHLKGPSVQHRPAYSSTQRQGSEGIVRPRTIPKTDIVSPTSHQNLSNIPKKQSKAQPSLIPNRRSMIPTPGKFAFPDN